MAKKLLKLVIMLLQMVDNEQALTSFISSKGN